MIELCSIVDCTGCGACNNICPQKAINMKADMEGFLRPEIDDAKCIGCGLCQKVCPPLHPVRKYRKVDHPIAAVVKDKVMLQKSSSGGMFSLLADWIFEREGVVYGVIMDVDKHVYHTVARNKQELTPMRGSKYIQSAPRMVYQNVKADLKAGRHVLFSGTPCQVAGLLNYLGKIDQSRLLTVDLVCHGTPSNEMFIVYLQKLAEEMYISFQDVENFKFRQEQSWGIAPRLFLEGKIVPISEKQNVYMKLFLTSRIFRPCCYTCAYTTPERISDITIADFWGIGEQVTFPYDTSMGCSLVLSNSEKGKQVFEEVCSHLDYAERDWSEALKYNHQLYQQSKLPKDRAKAVDYLFNRPLEETYNAFFNTPIIRLRHLAGGVLRKLHLRK